MKLLIVYWSGTGNTEKMAELIKEASQQNGSEVTLKSVLNANVSEINNYDVVAFGCPSMGSEELEECDMRPFIDDVKADISGKKVALFGSYGWGDGQWIRDWKEEMVEAGAIIDVEPLAINEYPDEEAEKLCAEFGKNIIK